MVETIAVQELGRTITFSFDDMMRYHGPGSPGGVAVAFKAMQRAFAVLSPDEPPQRRSIVVRTAFRGPGGRDGFEAVTRAVTDGRFTVDRGLVRSDRGRLLEDFVFEIAHRAYDRSRCCCAMASSPKSSSTWPGANNGRPRRRSGSTS